MNRPKIPAQTVTAELRHWYFDEDHAQYVGEIHGDIRKRHTDGRLTRLVQVHKTLELADYFIVYTKDNCSYVLWKDTEIKQI